METRIDRWVERGDLSVTHSVSLCKTMAQHWFPAQITLGMETPLWSHFTLHHFILLSHNLSQLELQRLTIQWGQMPKCVQHRLTEKRWYCFYVHWVWYREHLSWLLLINPLKHESRVEVLYTCCPWGRKHSFRRFNHVRHIWHDIIKLFFFINSSSTCMQQGVLTSQWS